jgi:hypothetical protein
MRSMRVHHAGGYRTGDGCGVCAMHFEEAVMDRLGVLRCSMSQLQAQKSAPQGAVQVLPWRPLTKLVYCN